MRTLEELSDIEEFLIQGVDQAIDRGQEILRRSNCSCALAVQFCDLEAISWAPQYSQAGHRMGLGHSEIQGFINGFDDYLYVHIDEPAENPRFKYPDAHRFYYMGVRVARYVVERQGKLETKPRMKIKIVE